MNIDQKELVRRLKAVLPSRWFGEATPILDALLGGLAAGWEYLYILHQYARRQARLSTASDVWLDLIAEDYFGARVVRRPGQSDGVFRQIVQEEFFRPRGTRRALIGLLTQLTGRAPEVFEPANTADSGGYGHQGAASDQIGGGVAYGTCGGWGSLNLPYQAFVTAYRPYGNGVARAAGWGEAAGGYGGGSLMYADMDIIQGHLSDAGILSQISQVLPSSVVVWTRISS